MGNENENLENKNGLENNNQNQNNNDSQNNGNQNQNQSGSSEKTFTQSEVNAMMAREKREGKASAFRSIGFSSEEDAKKALELFNLMNGMNNNSNNSQESNFGSNLNNNNHVNNSKAELQNSLNEANKRAQEAEEKLSLLNAGVDKNSTDDVLAIAKAKVTDSKNLDAVLEEMKKDSKYSVFFVSSSDEGTGSAPGQNRTGGSSGKIKYGERLAKSNQTGANKSSYFD